MSVPHTIELDWAAAPSETDESHGHGHVPSLCWTAASQLLKDDPEYQRYAHAPASKGKLPNFLSLTENETHTPEKVFDRLRWGGQVLFASKHGRYVTELARQYEQHGFTIERGPTFVRDGWCRWPVPFLSHKVHAFVARKMQLLPPGQTTSRFTYHVELMKHHDPHEPIVVHKRVPELAAVIDRLRKKHPDYPDAGIEKLARKFTDKIFPTFLTREAGMLLILQEHLPAPYNHRVPRLIDMQRDDRGFVRELKMSWLRNGGEPISHMEFARQSADLLRALHDVPRVIHLDLRLDNFVITPQGVGFVDFGSSVREGEDLSRNPLLQSLFGELLRTSQIQRMMEKMTISGQITSDIIRGGCHRVDKAADFFYLALQFNAPHSNPDLVEFIKYSPASVEACQLSALTSQILRPKDPAQPAFRSASDILRGIERMRVGSDYVPAA